MARRKKREGFPWSMIIAAAATFAAGVAFMLIFGKDYLPSTTPPLQKPTPAKTERSINLYFADEEGRGLKAESRTFKTKALEEELTEVIEAVINGPSGKLLNPMPEGTRLLSVKVSDGIVYVDLSREFQANHPGGSTWEIESIYSIVNTITLNYPAAGSVQILVEGEKLDTLAGHILIKVPLTANRKIIVE